jgi:sec-independent protein translocase protein TatB
MFNLDPGKLLVIAVVAIILLGPDKLPQFARQVGGAWRSFNEFRHRMEAEVRNTMPDLPPTSEIARLARSPSALLNHLSSMSSEDETHDEREDEEPDGSFQPPFPVDGTADGVEANGTAPHGGRSDGAPVPHPEPGSEAGSTDAPPFPSPASPRWPASSTPAQTPTPEPEPAAAPEAIVPGDPTLN